MYNTTDCALFPLDVRLWRLLKSQGFFVCFPDALPSREDLAPQLPVELPSGLQAGALGGLFTVIVLPTPFTQFTIEGGGQAGAPCTHLPSCCYL